MKPTAFRSLTMKPLYSLVLAVGLTSGLFAAGQEAKAAGCYGAFIIENPTSNTIHYQIKWGNGEWTTYSVGPGRDYAHWYPLDENDEVPTPQIRFDYICGDDDVTFKVYKVDVYATDYPTVGGKRYYFRYSPSGRYLDLYAR
jgi:hypothetical protein